MKLIHFIPNVGQYGNKLFPTILAAIICIKGNYSMNVPEIPLVHFKQSFLDKYNTSTTVEKSGTKIVSVNEKLFDINNLFLPRNYYQDYNIFLPYLDLIKSHILDLKSGPKNKTDIVLHLRLDGFNHNGHDSHILSPEFYTNILKNETFDKIYIVMATKSGRIWKKQQQHKERYLSYFSEFNNVVVSNDEYTDFEFIRSFDKIICSNSTFSWWASFLSDASIVYIPEFFEGKHANLNLSSNPKFHVTKQTYVNIETMENVDFSFS
jgi:hypothetical protein